MQLARLNLGSRVRCHLLLRSPLRLQTCVQFAQRAVNCACLLLALSLCQRVCVQFSGSGSDPGQGSFQAPVLRD